MFQILLLQDVSFQLINTLKILSLNKKRKKEKTKKSSITLSENVLPEQENISTERGFFGMNLHSPSIYGRKANTNEFTAFLIF